MCRPVLRSPEPVRARPRPITRCRQAQTTMSCASRAVSQRSAMDPGTKVPVAPDDPWYSGRLGDVLLYILWHSLSLVLCVRVCVRRPVDEMKCTRLHVQDTTATSARCSIAPRARTGRGHAPTPRKVGFGPASPHDRGHCCGPRSQLSGGFDRSGGSDDRARFHVFGFSELAVGETGQHHHPPPMTGPMGAAASVVATDSSGANVVRHQMGAIQWAAVAPQAAVAPWAAAGPSLKLGEAR